MMKLAVFLLVLASAVVGRGADPLRTERGRVQFVPTEAEGQVAERFRMGAREFAWQASRLHEVENNFEIWEVTFPSPVKTAEEANNTVHCEYFRSLRGGKRPAVIVLHILGGDFPLSRLFCNALAQHGVHALFLKMPYYGPRREANSKRRMVSSDPEETVAGMTQAVLDVRFATAWLAAREEVDAEQLGAFGISLGGITAALAVTAEPKLQKACLLLAGGSIAHAGWESKEARPLREQWLAQGKTREEFVEILSVVDPVTYGAAARGKRILMLNATDDEVIPKVCTEALWTAFGQPEIQWYSGGHFSVAWHLFGALWRVGRFFGEAGLAGGGGG
jgi:dienelactone hydrolase